MGKSETTNSQNLENNIFVRIIVSAIRRDDINKKKGKRAARNSEMWLKLARIWEFQTNRRNKGTDIFSTLLLARAPQLCEIIASHIGTACSCN